MFFYSPRRIQFILQPLEKSESQLITTTRKRMTTMLYKGSCHCGNIAFEVEGDLTSALACNCSICSRKGSLLWFMPRDSLRLSVRDEEKIDTYTFNKHVISIVFARSAECIRSAKVQARTERRWRQSISDALTVWIWHPCRWSILMGARCDAMVSCA
jgi:hypothetical protein